MELNQLRYFVAVAEMNNFTRAAARCAVAQPSLSQQIKKLEEELGYSLFDRGRRTELTDAGRALLPRARRILAEVCDAETLLLDDIEKGVGPLAVGAIPTMAPYLLPPLLERFVSAYPRCDLHIHEDYTERLIAAVLANKLDCAIVSTPIDEEGVELQLVGSERMLVAMHDDHPLARPNTVSIEALEQEPVIVIDDMHCLGRQVSDFCVRRRMGQRIVCSSAQLSTVRRLVGLGIGVSLLPEMCARADRAGGRAYRSLAPEAPARDIALAWHEGRDRSFLAVELAIFLEEDLRSGIHRYDG